MDQRQLGRSGLWASALGLGCNNFGHRLDVSQSDRVVNAAIDRGITFFDTADFYGAPTPEAEGRGRSEEYLGQALRGRRRHDVIIATKFAFPMGEGPLWAGGSRRYVIKAAEESLRRLGTDYIDLYQMHVPDPRTPIDETLRALDDLVKRGDVRYVGCCNFPAWRIVEADHVARRESLVRFVSVQNQYSLLVREAESEVLPACESHGLGFLPWFPLASGLLTGKYRRGEPPPEGSRLSRPTPVSGMYLNDRNFSMVEQLEAFAARHGKTVGALAVAWLLSRSPVASVIAGASTEAQIDQNVSALEWKLTPEDLEEIDRITIEGLPYFRM